jgi:GT2 family glycosyltransferase
MTIALIVPVYKKFDLFTRLMHSVDTEIRPYVIDSYYNNRGCAGAWNEGMRKAILDGYRYAIITNDDVEFLPGTIEKIYTTLKETDAVLVSAAQNADTPDATEIYEGADFFCFGVDMIKLIDTCGSFDENFFPAYFEDNDMHYRMRLANVKGYIHPGAGARHVGSATQNADPHNPVCPSERFEQLREYFRTKWGGVPGEERFTKPFNNQEKEIWDWDERIPTI